MKNRRHTRRFLSLAMHARVRAPQGVFVDFGGLRDHASLLYGRGSVTLGRSDRCTYVNNPERTATLATIAQT